jgi:hypothetical protein
VKPFLVVSQAHVGMEQGYLCPPWTRKGVVGTAHHSYAGGRLRQRFSPRRQVELVELLLKLTGIGLWRSTAAWSFAIMNDAMDR